MNVADIAHDGRLNEIALAKQHLTAGHDLAVLLSFLQVTLHFLELRFVLQGPHLGFLFYAVIDHYIAGQSAKFAAHLVIL